MKQLINDSHFLASLNIMDYSLLVGIHDRNRRNKTTINKTITTETGAFQDESSIHSNTPFRQTSVHFAFPPLNSSPKKLALTLDTADDSESIQEVVNRRYSTSDAKLPSSPISVITDDSKDIRKKRRSTGRTHSRRDSGSDTTIERLITGTKAIELPTTITTTEDVVLEEDLEHDHEHGHEHELHDHEIDEDDEEDDEIDLDEDDEYEEEHFDDGDSDFTGNENYHFKETNIPMEKVDFDGTGALGYEGSHLKTIFRSNDSLSLLSKTLEPKKTSKTPGLFTIYFIHFNLCHY